MQVEKFLLENLLPIFKMAENSTPIAGSLPLNDEGIADASTVSSAPSQLSHVSDVRIEAAK